MKFKPSDKVLVKTDIANVLHYKEFVGQVATVVEVIQGESKTIVVVEAWGRKGLSEWKKVEQSLYCDGLELVKRKEKKT